MIRNRTHPSRTIKPCSPARIAALVVLEAVFTQGKSLLEVLPELEKQCPDSRDLALAREIVSGTCRWHGRIRYLLRQFAAKLENFPPTIQRILEMSVYQLNYLDRIPPYAILSEAVELAHMHRMPGLASAVNGILRELTRKGQNAVFPDQEKNLPDWLTTTQSHPGWMVRRWLELWSREDVTALCHFNNTLAPLSLRVRGNRLDALAELERMECKAFPDSRIPNRIVLDSGAEIPRDLFDSDRWVAQDGAAMLVAPLVDPQPGWSIWDVCAAPGGKTLHLADLSKDQARILATDIDPVRLQKLTFQAQKFRLNCIQAHRFNALGGKHPLEDERFDAILIDAPCSGWGTFRRHPDLRWRLRGDDSGEFGKQAMTILENAHRRLKPGGVLVYATCTLSPEENENVVFEFVRRHPHFTVEPVQSYLPPDLAEAQTKDGFLFLFPSRWEMDGAFAARLRKQR